MDAPEEETIASSCLLDESKGNFFAIYCFIS